MAQTFPHVSSPSRTPRRGPASLLRRPPGVLGHLDHLALLFDTLAASLAPPATSAMLEEGVLGHLNLLAPVSNALEIPVALPVVSDVDVGMVRYARGVFRPAESRKPADPQRE